MTKKNFWLTYLIIAILIIIDQVTKVVVLTNLKIQGTEIPVIGNFFAIVFFLLLVIAALTTSLTIYQVIISVLFEKFKIRLKGAINISLIGVFVFGNIPCIMAYGPWRDVRFINRNIFDAFDFISGNICFVLTALGATLFVGWVMKDEAKAELDNNGLMKQKVTNLWFNYVKYVVPFIILAIFIYGLI